MYRIVLALSLLAVPTCGVSAQAQLADKLRGYSLEVEVNARAVYQPEGRAVSEETNTRTMRLYVSEKGRLFDFSGASGTDMRTGRLTGESRKAQVVEWGQVWTQGSVGQRWSTSGATLLRERIYPWGRQHINIAISGDRSSCSATTNLKSSRPDKKFFLYRWADNKPIEVLDYRMSSQRCTIMRGNIFTSTDV
jgi:hypothetical protein